MLLTSRILLVCLKRGLTCCFILIYIVFKIIGSQDHNRKYNNMTLCVFYSVDHGGESRITAGLHKCMYTHTNTHYTRLFL